MREEGGAHQSGLGATMVAVERYGYAATILTSPLAVHTPDMGSHMKPSPGPQAAPHAATSSMNAPPEPSSAISWMPGLDVSPLAQTVNLQRIEELTI